jgi:hypothetical protein
MLLTLDADQMPDQNVVILEADGEFWLMISFVPSFSNGL